MSELNQWLFELAELELQTGQQDRVIFEEAMCRADKNETVAASYYWNLRAKHWRAEAAASKQGEDVYFEGLRSYRDRITRKSKIRNRANDWGLAVAAFFVLPAFVVVSWYSYIGFLRGSRLLPLYLFLALLLLVISAAILRGLRKRRWTSF